MNGRALAVLGIASLAGIAAAFVSQHEASTTSRPADRATTVSPRSAAAASNSLASASAATTGFAFSSSFTTSVRGYPQAVAVGDVNGDFRDDVVLVTEGSAVSDNMVHVFLQQPDGRLADPQLYPFPSAIPSLALGDLNNDGTLDIVVGGNWKLTTLMVANGEGGFTTTNVENLQPSNGCEAVSVMDINLDGNADVICLVTMAKSTFFFGDGNGGVASKAEWQTGSIGPIDLRTADVTGDGLPDMIATESKWHSVYVVPHNGSSGFGQGHSYNLPTSPQSIAVGDFNGDGRNDLAVNMSIGVSIFDQDDRGQLREPRTLPTNNSAMAMDATDLDRNGLTDLVLQHTNFTDRPDVIGHYLQEYGTGLSAEILTTIPQPTVFNRSRDTLGSGDLNGDGCGDVAMSGETAGLVVLYGTGCATPSAVAKAPQRGADMDGDGKKDLLWHHPGTREIYRWLMDGATIRQGIGGIFAPAGSTPRTLADFNQDGRADILLADGTDIRMYVTQADGSYNLEQVAAYPPGWEILGAGDIDRDGAADLFWYHPGTRQLYFWMMDGPNIRSGRGGMYAPPNVAPVAIDDFDGDGTTDILLANSREIWMYSNTAVGTLTSKRVEVFPFGWHLGGTGDVDGDGKADLLWHQPQTRDLYYWLMDGATIKSTRAAPPTPMGTAPAAFGDFNGDGLADVLLPSAQNIWMYQGDNLGGFTSYYVAPYPVGWTLY